MAIHHYDRPKTPLFRIFHRVGILVFIGLACLLISCDGNLLEGISDDDSYEAKLEEGLMALDDEDYDKAVDIFKRLKSDYPNKEEVCVYLSNAYAGLTGIDTFNLLDTISELEDTGDEGSIDMIGLLLGNADGFITPEAMRTKSTYLEIAQSTLDDCIGYDNLDTDESVQAGLVGLGNAALFIANLVITEQDNNEPIELTEEYLDGLYAGIPDFDDSISVDDLNISLNLIKDAVDSLEEILGDVEDNDLSDSFEEFLKELDPDWVIGEEVNVTIPKIEDYIGTLVGEEVS